MSRKGLFITFEGTDGSGKSTQIALLESWLSEKGIGALITREPGGTAIGEKIRNIILDRENSEMSHMTEALLYAASRAQHVDQVIRPALSEGRTVISDRFVDSSTVYQAYGRNLGESVEVINEYAMGGCVPDVTFLLKLEPETGIKRALNGVPDRIESEELLFHTLVYEAYLELERKYPERILGIDATGKAEDIHKEITSKIYELLK